MRYALKLAYEGGAFSGWQTQPSANAVQDAVEAGIGAIASHRVATICAGRTDAGVHALAQTVHFDSDAQRPLQAWVRGVNAHLPPGIAIQRALAVDQDFHARYSAIRRAYSYLIYRAAQRHPMYDARAGWAFQALDLAKLRIAADALAGEHDFSSFRSSQCQASTPVRRLESLVVRESGPLVVIELRANAFLHHMVRNIVGALVWVGIGRRPPDWIAELLAARDRRLGAPTFSPRGLYLTGVEYPTRYDIGSWPPATVPLGAA